MTAAEVRAEMEQRGVRLTLQGDQLCCRGGRKRVSPALLAALGAVRAELLAILRNEQERERENEHGHEREDECEREALMAEIADLPAADQLVILGYLCCRHCRRWLLAKVCEPDAEARPVCRDSAASSASSRSCSTSRSASVRGSGTLSSSQRSSSSCQR